MQKQNSRNEIDEEMDIEDYENENDITFARYSVQKEKRARPFSSPFVGDSSDLRSFFNERDLESLVIDTKGRQSMSG